MTYEERLIVFNKYKDCAIEFSIKNSIKGVSVLDKKASGLRALWNQTKSSVDGFLKKEFIGKEVRTAIALERYGLSSRKQFTSLRKAMKERREDGFTIPDVPSKYQSRAQQYYEGWFDFQAGEPDKRDAAFEMIPDTATDKAYNRIALMLQGRNVSEIGRIQGCSDVAIWECVKGAFKNSRKELCA